MPGPVDYGRLRIVPDPDTKEWWEGARQKKFLVRICNNDGFKWFPPVPACAICGEMQNIGWFETSGKGVIHSYIVPTQPILAAFVNAVPYVVATVELPDCTWKDGEWFVRVGGVLMDDEDKAEIGAPVELVWVDSPQMYTYADGTEDNLRIPRWQVTGKGEWHFTG
jgi:uncharacterized OB-fold protein